MTPARIPIVITDLDNTLYNWVDFFAPSVRGMVHALSKDIDLPEEKLYESIRRIFKEHGSLEYPVRAEDLDFLRDRSKDDMRRINGVMFGAFRRCRTKNLKLYDGVLDFLQWTNRRRIPVIAVTNAPLEIAQARLVDLNVNLFISAVAGPTLPLTQREIEINESQPNLFSVSPERRRSHDKFFPKVYPLNQNEIKPNPEAYLGALGPYKSNEVILFVIGDSLQKDLAPAQAIGAKTIWAKYGTEVEKDNIQTLLDITPWTSQQIAHAYSNSFEPDFVVDKISQLKDIIEYELSNSAISTNINQ